MNISLGPPELVAAVKLKYISPPPWYIRGMRYTAIAAIALTSVLVIAIALEWQRFSVKPLPVSQQGPIQVLAGDNVTSIAPAETQNHTEVGKLTEFGEFVPKAAIASEDSAYYWHLGVNPLGILRALITNVKSGELREGGSTITQQLARLLLRSYVGTNDSAGRKWREAVAATKLSFNYSKDDLLTVYLNRVYLGNGVYGLKMLPNCTLINLQRPSTYPKPLPSPEFYLPPTCSIRLKIKSWLWHTAIAS
jgi:membrane peptidoglycan carboxypeptidase